VDYEGLDQIQAPADLGYVPEHDTPEKLVDAFVAETARQELAAR